MRHNLRFDWHIVLAAVRQIASSGMNAAQQVRVESDRVTYTVADNSHALRTMMLLEGEPDHRIDQIRQFPRNRWDPYLASCRELAVNLGIQLRNIDRAFLACAGRRR